MFVCSDLIGMPYELGADGTNGKIDCIHLCYIVWEEYGIKSPPFNPEWYGATRLKVGRDLLKWGYRVPEPRYDGDIVLVPQDSWAFAGMWEGGILYLNPYSKRVQWSQVQGFTTLPCFRSRDSLLMQ